ncbi:MAG: acyltransferase family protein [Muribaculaceae bacterium]
MSRSDSTIIKGVAILLMLFYHLFYKGNEPVSDIVDIGDMPLVYYFARIVNPVAFFMIISGYGTYVNRFKSSLKHTLLKLCHLYILFWLICLIFIIISRFALGNDTYPGSVMTIIRNVTGVLTSWNYEAWFLLPYALVALSARSLIRLIDNRNPFAMYIISFATSILCAWLTPRLQQPVFDAFPIAKIPLLYFNLLPAFILGVYMAKYQIIGKIQIGRGKCWGLLFIVLCARALFPKIPCHDLFVATVIILFLKAPRPKWIDNVLTELGHRSTSMWLIHSWFCYYLFKDFIYSFNWPIAIFLVLLSVSWLSAVIIDYLNKNIQRIIFR